MFVIKTKVRNILTEKVSSFKFQVAAVRKPDTDFYRLSIFTDFIIASRSSIRSRS